MSIREEQCNKVCRILDDVLANRPTERDSLIVAVRKAFEQLGNSEQLPPAQPEEIALHESCTDCPLYDKDRYRCPRFNKVIPETLRELQLAQSEQRWIPVSERMPEDYEDVLVWFEYFRYGNYNCLYQMHGIGSYSSGYNSWLINQETGWNELKVFAWMPLPEPYAERRQDGDK